MNKCYVCEVENAHDNGNGMFFCGDKCRHQFNLLATMAEVADAQDRKPKLTAYSDMSLFEPVDMELDDNDFCEPNAVSFAEGEVCIEAMPQVETEVIFLVKEKNGKTVFEPRKKDAKTFNSQLEAYDFIQQNLKPAYGDKWKFLIWHKSALIK